MLTCASRYSGNDIAALAHLVTFIILSCTSLKPFFSKREMISPTRPRCTPSGLIITSGKQMGLEGKLMGM